MALAWRCLAAVLVALAVAFLLRRWWAPSPLQCRDEVGRPVAWWVLMKFPGRAASRSKQRALGGYHYVYADSATPWGLSPFALNSVVDGAVARTLSPLYNRGSGAGYVMYNDESPDGQTSSTKAHAKGIVGFVGRSGFWLVHSIPQFPSMPSSGSYAGLQPRQAVYGQSALCVSLTDVDQAGALLLVTDPFVYGSNAGAQDLTLVPNLARVMAGRGRGPGARNASAALSVAAPDRFVAFAKSKAAGADLYEDLVAPGLKVDLWVETWCRAPCLDSYCRPRYRWGVENVAALNVLGEVPFERASDHSKWAVSVAPGWTCVGDISPRSGALCAVGL